MTNNIRNRRMRETISVISSVVRTFATIVIAITGLNVAHTITDITNDINIINGISNNDNLLDQINLLNQININGKMIEQEGYGGDFSTKLFDEIIIKEKKSN